MVHFRKFLLPILRHSLPVFRKADSSVTKNYMLFPQSSMTTWYSTQPKSEVQFLLSLSEQKCLLVNFFRYSSSVNSTSEKKEDLVILLGQDNSVIGIKTREEAIQLANKKKLRLQKLDKQTAHKKYPVYQLTSSVQLIKGEETGQKGKQLDGKNLTFSYKISDHDLEVKIHTIEKWLKKKNYQVKVFVTGEVGKEQTLNILYKKIEDHFGETARLLQKVVKNGNMKFYILRPKEKDSLSGGS